VAFYDRMGGGKSQPASILFGTEVGIENARHVFRSDPSTLILNRNPHVPPRFQAGGMGIRQGHIRRLDEDLTPFGHRLHRIDDDILNDLANLPLVDIDRPEATELDSNSGRVENSNRQSRPVPDCWKTFSCKGWSRPRNEATVLVAGLLSYSKSSAFPSRPS
jgi:hypothetical protein